MKKEEKKTYLLAGIIGLIIVLALFANKGGTEVGQAVKTATISTGKECKNDERYEKLCICQPAEGSLGSTPSASLCEKCTDVCEDQGDECIGAVESFFNPDKLDFQLVYSSCDGKSSMS